MDLIHLLEHQTTFWSITAPTFAWAMAGLLFFGSILLLWRLETHVRADNRQCAQLRKRLEEFSKANAARPGEGVTLPGWESLRELFDQFPLLRSAWRTHKARVIRRRGPSGQYEYWSADSASAVFSQNNHDGGSIKWNFYSAVPGMVTGLGLMTTFLAILAALLKVKLVETRVEGLELLIQGLSGKFVSSIFALLGATIFLFFERRLRHQVAVGREGLVHAVDDALPVLSSTQVIADMHRDLAEQSDAFRNFNATLSPLLKQSFSESMGPTLERMLTSIEGLNQFLRQSEAQRQQSIAGSLETVLRNLQESLNSSIGQMGEVFMKSVSGSTSAQFDRVAQSLSAAASLLENMNGQFEQTQATLNTLIATAHSNTTSQLETGKRQIEEITLVLRGIMDKLNDSTGSSITQMREALSSAILELRDNVADLTSKMSTSVEASTNQVSVTARSVLEQTESSTSRNQERLSQLLDKHQAQIELVEEMRSTIESTLVKMGEMLASQAEVAQQSRGFAEQVTSGMTAIQRAAADFRLSQQSVQEVSQIFASQCHQWSQAIPSQEQMWRSIHASMSEYQKTFQEVNGEAKSLLDQINEQIERHLEITQQGYEKLAKTTDEHLANVTNRLRSSIEELDEVLETLSESLSQVKNKE